MHVVSSCALLLGLSYCAHISAQSLTMEPFAASVAAVRQEPGVVAEQPLTGIGLHITIVSGQNVTNVTGRKFDSGVVIEVDDRNNQPVAGASVSVVSPGNAPGLTFQNGSRTLTAVTDNRGRVNVGRVTAINSGAFELVVTAFYHGDKAGAVISETNSDASAKHEGEDANVGTTPTDTSASRGGVKKSGGLSNGAKAALIGAAGAVAIGVIFATMHHGSSSAAAVVTAPTATIGAGGITVGAPH